MTVSKRVALSVFMVAFAFGLNITGIMPVLGMISEKYADVGISMIQMLQTLPYLLLMVGSLCVGFLAARIDKKVLLVFGLGLIGVCGVAPFFFDSFAVLLVSRILIGFGFGVVSPLNTAVIAEFIEPEKRSGYLGLHVVGMGVGAMVGNLLGGVLAKAGLSYFYLVYAIAFVSMAVVAAVLQRSRPAARTDQGGKKTAIHITAMVYVLSLMSFLHTLFINAYNTNISIYLTENITSDPGASGIVTGINSAFALLVGACFSKISGVLKDRTLPVAVFAAAAGYGALFVLPGMAGVLVCSALCGMSLSAFMAMSSFLISISVEPDAVAMASSIFSIIGGIGGLLAPVITGALANGIGGNTAIHQFAIAGVGMALLGGFTTAVIVGNRKKTRAAA
ncbi:MAG: MFS transporter [Lachnospiraceae bacterium]